MIPVSPRLFVSSRRLPALRGGALLLAAALALPAASFAGVEVETATREVDAEEGPSTERATLRMDASKLRIDAGGGRGSLLYDAEAGRAWLLDHGDKRYVEVDRSQARALARQAETLQKEVRQRLEGRLSPEQMAAAEEMLSGRLGSAAEEEAEKVRVQQTEGRDTVAGVPCRELEVHRGEERVAELCTATPSEAGIPPESFAALQDAATFMEESVGALAPGEMRQVGVDLLESVKGLDAFPMRARTYEDGALVTESVVERIEQAAVPASAFALPEGYEPMFAVQVRGEGASEPAPERPQRPDRP